MRVLNSCPPKMQGNKNEWVSDSPRFVQLLPAPAKKHAENGKVHIIKTMPQYFLRPLTQQRRGAQLQARRRWPPSPLSCRLHLSSQQGGRPYSSIMCLETSFSCRNS